jgi:hypothetical protein
VWRAAFDPAARPVLVRAPAAASRQIDLHGQCPPIEKMDATLSTLKACKWAARRAATLPLRLHARARQAPCEAMQSA